MKDQPFPILIIVLLVLAFSQCKERTPPIYPNKIIQLKPEKAAALAKEIREAVAVTVIEGLELSLWASDSLITDPVAISIDPQGGIYYTNGTRMEHSEFDIRGFRDWMTASISFQSVEDRRKFLRETLAPEKSEKNKKIMADLNDDGSHDWRDLLVEKESAWRISDESGDGIADKAQLYIEDFNEEISDLANGILFHEGDVFIGIGPDLWRTKDLDKDGIADVKESISHGYAVHIGFGSHGMSGVTVGPDGRIWWGIGDIGMNVIDKDGNHWKYPNQGVIVRSEPDGSNFEVFAAGLRNTHEFVFDQYGNLITEDNDGDHEGERERLVYITNGSDSGWRTNWQFGKYTDPDNNKYKVWMDEKLGIPRWEGQAAYITPPIINYVNGPTGMVYNPGTTLGERWYNHFFIAEFRGSPANSPIHAFTLKPKGASFELDTTIEVVRGVLPTGLDWGPDGALYFSDWIDGWGVKEQGRLWKLDILGGAQTAIRQETKKLIQSDFSKKTAEELGALLAHQDMRIRLKAQFELAKRDEKGYETLLAAANQKAYQLARIHGLWGIGQLARKQIARAEAFVPFLKDADPEIQAQAAKMIGDVRYKKAGNELISLLKHESLRVQFFAAEALGRTAEPAGSQPIIAMLEANNDEDVWLRHAGTLALARIGKAEPIIALKEHPSRALRIAAVVALRRMKNAGIAEFLNDKDEYIVAEAARGIHDDYSIEDALPALADLLKTTQFRGEPLIRRAINANLRIGDVDNLSTLVNYATQKEAPEALRAEAIATISTWVNPSVLDRVDGRRRRFIRRDYAPVKKALSPVLGNLLAERNEVVQEAAIKATGKLRLSDFSKTIFNLLKNNTSENVRMAALSSLSNLEYSNMDDVLATALADKSKEVRSAALGMLSEADLPEEKTVALFANILKNGTIEEQQATLEALGKLKGSAAIDLLDNKLDALLAGKAVPEIQLDIIEAVENNKDAALLQKLTTYQTTKSATDPLAAYRETLAGGDRRKGQSIFYENEAAQCVRCHAIWEWGGDAGPVLNGIGSKRSPEELLESLVEPSAKLALGYGVVTLTMKDGASTAGIITEETDTHLSIKIGRDKIQKIDKSSIAARENVPSSMPGVKEILTKKEIRDLVAFLFSLKAEES